MLNLKAISSILKEMDSSILGNFIPMDGLNTTDNFATGDFRNPYFNSLSRRNDLKSKIKTSRNKPKTKKSSKRHLKRVQKSK